MRPDQETSSEKQTIAERLALLKTNGENNWRKRVVKKELSEDNTKYEKINVEPEFSKPFLREVNSLDLGLKAGAGHQLQPLEGGKM